MKSEKSLAVAQHILNCCKALDRVATPMKLLKLVYVAHGHKLGRLGVPLLEESVQAWKYGPIIESVYEAVRANGSMPVERVPNADPEKLTQEEKELIEFVVQEYGVFDAITLSVATHQDGTPWRTTWDHYKQNATISNDLIEYFYKELLKSPTHSAL